jgi:aspartate/tyrosine/aromatic aminotransferase
MKIITMKIPKGDSAARTPHRREHIYIFFRLPRRRNENSMFVARTIMKNMSVVDEKVCAHIQTGSDSINTNTLMQAAARITRTRFQRKARWGLFIVINTRIDLKR